jgi:glycosyltransferase involved in cell wall biosynthesis
LLSEITPVVLTFNEAPNIARTLAMLDWARRIVVVDSGSTDGTKAICSNFANVAFYERPFTTHSAQWNWALRHAAIDTNWVLCLDADYVLTDKIVRELRALELEAIDVNGYRASFRYCIFGKPLRASLYPDVTVLFQREKGVYEQDGHTQRLSLQGPVAPLRGKIFHDDRKPFASWLRSQDRYAALECEHLSGATKATLSAQDKLRKMIFVAPFIVPLYCLFARGLILDGLPGLHYTFQRTIAECILSIKLIEKKWGARS